VGTSAIAKIIDEEINISLITKIELLVFSNIEQNLEDFVSCAKFANLSCHLTPPQCSNLLTREICRFMQLNMQSY